MTTIEAPAVYGMGRVVPCEMCEGAGVVVRLPSPQTGRFNYALWRQEVTEAEIDLAISRHPFHASRERSAWNIAFGKYLGTYEPHR